MSSAGAFGVCENVPLIERADRQFWSEAWRHSDSDKTYEFLTRPARVKKRMAVWDNTPTTRRYKSKNGRLMGFSGIESHR